jgi:hypothetical protein
MESTRNSTGQFVKGVSGNPTGRPRKTYDKMRVPQHFATVMREVAAMTVPMKIDGEEVEVATTRAMLIQLRRTGLQGCFKSQKLFFELQRAALEEDVGRHSLIREAYLEIERLREENATLKSRLPRGNVIHVPPRPGMGMSPAVRPKEPEAETDNYS